LTGGPTADRLSSWPDWRVWSSLVCLITVLSGVSSRRLLLICDYDYPDSQWSEVRGPRSQSAWALRIDVRVRDGSLRYRWVGIAKETRAIFDGGSQSAGRRKLEDMQSSIDSAGWIR